VNVKLLLDENLSPRVAETLAREDGVDAVHVRDRGLLGALDHTVLEAAFAEDRVLVTSNVDDFVKLGRAKDLHPGIVLIEDGGLLRDEQLQAVRKAVAVLEGERDLVNRILRIWLDGKTVFEEIPPPA
jgi:predicted nuclease of predicted toxin-antitoxin system